MLITGDRESASLALARVDALHTGLTQIVLEGGNLDGIAAEVARVLDVGVLFTSTDGRERAAALAPFSRSSFINTCTPLEGSLAQPHIGNGSRPG